MKTFRTLSVLLFALVTFISCEKESSNEVVENLNEILPDTDPNSESAENKAYVTSVDQLVGKWRLTHIWTPQYGWNTAKYTTIDFYNNTFLYYANQWNIKNSSVGLSSKSPIADLDDISYGSRGFNFDRASNKITISPDFQYNAWLYWGGNGLLIRSYQEKESNVYHWFERYE